MKNVFALPILIISCSILVSCNGDTKASEQKQTDNNSQSQSSQASPPLSATAAVNSTTVEDGPAVATIETDNYTLKIHRVIPFTLKPKSYEPFKVDVATKLIALDVSIRSKLSSPLDLSKILGMAVIKGKGQKNLVAPWVVAAHEVDYPEANHQKEYDALWSSAFEPKGFHRAILFGLNPSRDEKDFTLTVPGIPDYNNPSMKSVAFSAE